MTLKIGDFGRLMAAKRGAMGVRAAAALAGVSAATFSRVENGHMPDLATFAKICRWLERDPREFLDIDSIEPQSVPAATVHFKKSKTVSEETAKALAELILVAQRALRARDGLIGR